MNADSLKGLAVVALAEGTRLGQVNDVLFQPQPFAMTALQVQGEGGNFVIPLSLVQQIGTDAVTVEDSSATQAASTGGTLGGLLGLRDLHKLKVVDAAGTFLGTIKAAEIDPANGQIIALQVHKGGVLGLGGTTTTIAAAAIRSVGPELLTVAADSAPASTAP